MYQWVNSVTQVPRENSFYRLEIIVVGEVRRSLHSVHYEYERFFLRSFLFNLQVGVATRNSVANPSESLRSHSRTLFESSFRETACTLFARKCAGVFFWRRPEWTMQRTAALHRNRTSVFLQGTEFTLYCVRVIVSPVVHSTRHFLLLSSFFPRSKGSK